MVIYSSVTPLMADTWRNKMEFLDMVPVWIFTLGFFVIVALSILSCLED